MFRKIVKSYKHGMTVTHGFVNYTPYIALMLSSMCLYNPHFCNVNACIY